LQALDIRVYVGRREHLTARFAEYYFKIRKAARLEPMYALTPAPLEGFFAKEPVTTAVILSEYSPEVTGRITALVES